MKEKLTKAVFLKSVRERVGRGDGVTLIPYDSFPGTTKEITDMYWECREDIKKMRGIYYSEILKGSWTWCIAIYRVPCREFKNLNAYLKRWKLREIGFLDVRTDNVSGKRSSVDYDWRVCIAHSGYTCERILEFLKNGKLGTAGKVDIKFGRKEHCGGRYDSDGQDRECEWDGEYVYYLRLAIYTKTGRLRCEETFSL